VVVLAVGVSTGLVVVGAIFLSRYKFVMNYKIVSECGKAICSIELGLREGKRTQLGERNSTIRSGDGTWIFR
jgi:hypothetical protein